MKILTNFDAESLDLFYFQNQTPETAGAVEAASTDDAGADESIISLLSRYSEDPETDKQAIEEAAAFFGRANVTVQLIETAIADMTEESEEGTKLSAEDLGRLKELLTSDQARLQAILNKNDKVEGTPLTEAEKTELATMKNADLLKKDDSERLRFVSQNSVSAEQLASGDVTEMTFSFDEEGNDELYRNTTAGQVLPPNVRQVVASGPKQDGSTVFTRRGYNGEFFSESGVRLKIHDNTAIKVVEGEDGFVASDNLEGLRQPFIERATSGLAQAEITEDSPEYDRLKSVAEMAALKGVDVDLALLVARGKRMSGVEDEADFRSKFEDALTDAHRIQDGVNPSDLRTGEGRTTLKQAANWVGHYLEGPEATKAGLVGLGYEEADVQSAIAQVGHTNLGAGIEGDFGNVVVQPGATRRLHPKGYVWRSDRHNNPTASNYSRKFAQHLTNAGFVEGVDFWRGESGPGCPGGTVAYKDFKTGVAGSVVALRTGQIKRWYGKVGGHQYAYTSGFVNRVAESIRAGGGNITSNSPEGLQAAFDNMPFEGQQGVVMAIYKNEGGGNMFTPISPGQEYLSVRGSRDSF